MKKDKHLQYKVDISAPGKLMLFGEHAVVYGKPCIVTAVNQRMRVRIITTKDLVIELTAPEVEIKNFRADITIPLNELPKGARFVFTAVKNFFKEYKVSSGLMIETKSDFSSSFGFGSSSAVTVCVVKGLTEIFGIKISNKKLFDICYKTVLDVQGVGSGFDIAAAIWGGTLYFVGGGKKITQISKGSLPLIVGYTGVKADTATLVKKVAELKKLRPKLVNSIFESIVLIVENAKKLLENGDYEELGNLANLNQGFLDALGVNTSELSSLIYATREAGAFGAKLSGAGGGDCMIAFCPNSKKIKVQNSIKKAGGTVIQIQTNAPGVKIERMFT